MIIRQTLLVLVALLVTGAASHAGEPPAASDSVAFAMVSEQEFQQAKLEQSRLGRAERMSVEDLGPIDPDGPRITVEAPALGAGRLKSPLQISVKWQAAQGAAVDLKSLKVIYIRDGVWLDRTDRIRKCGTTVARLAGINCRVDAAGLFVEKAELAKGSYQLVVQLADTKQRATRREFSVEIG